MIQTTHTHHRPRYPVLYVIPKPMLSALFPPYKSKESGNAFHTGLKYFGSFMLIWAALLVE